VADHPQGRARGRRRLGRGGRGLEDDLGPGRQGRDGEAERQPQAEGAAGGAVDQARGRGGEALQQGHEKAPWTGGWLPHSSMKMASMDRLNIRAIRKARGREGSYLPVSMA